MKRIGQIKSRGRLDVGAGFTPAPQVYRFWQSLWTRSMRLSPSGIKNSLHGDGYFHADLLFEQSARKFRRFGGPTRGRRGLRGIEHVDLTTEAGDQLAGA